MKRFCILFLIACAVVAALAGCHGGTEEKISEDIQIVPGEMADHLEANLTLDDYLAELDGEVALEIYNLSPEQVVEISVYAGTGATAEEIAVISAKDQEGAAAVKEAFAFRIEAQKLGFENYVPEELVKLEEPVIEQVGNTLIMVVCNDTEEAKREIDDYCREIK